MEKRSADVINLFGNDDFIIAIPTFDALDLLASNDRFHSWLTDNSTKQIVVADVVQIFLAQRISGTAELQGVNNFLENFADRIVFQRTEYGKLIETALKDQDFEFPPEIWELAIISYSKFVTGNLFEHPVVELIEDEWFEMHAGIDIDSVKMIPVSRFLASLGSVSS